jgi:hypothetical protein
MAQASKGGWMSKWWRGGVVFSVVMLGIAVLAGNDSTQDSQGAASNAGWGAESLVELQSGLDKISPIALANACGMGASSCFKCHNGKRAGAPKMDPAKSPWHVDHKKVNNSCVGCHKGNSRMMKEELAHAGLLKGPRGGAEACGGCHKADLAKVEATYKSVTGGSK